MKHLRWVLCVMCYWSGFAWAADPDNSNEWDALRAQVKELRTQAKEMKAKAQREFEVADKACWDKFLVSSCQEDAKHLQRNANKEATRVNMEALAIERRVAAHDREIKLAKKPSACRSAIRKPPSVRSRFASRMKPIVYGWRRNRKSRQRLITCWW